ncbi:MAG: Glycosyltransferase [Burkholderiaceae bacterium]|jgi:glycosyltransferase involved in cell wall biosynthesis|nr:MAG: Glycosyltransferase [Burkholderiaceae bacterium]
MRSEMMQATAGVEHACRYIYIAGPWGPKGGGMYKVADYLIQAQAAQTPVGAAQLRHLDTRGGAGPVYSLWVLAIALVRLLQGRVSGQLAGVHVNVAERLSLLRKGAVIAMCRVLGVPAVLHLHAAQLHHFYAALPGPLQAMVRWMFSLPSGCVVLGSAAQQFVTRELRVPADRVTVVFNGVPEPTEVRRATAAEAVRRVLFVGNLSERKGVSDLLRALALPGFDRDRVEVTLAGGGDVQAYRTMAQELGIGEFVRFEGWVDQRQVARLMASADVLVLPSYDEGLPLVILEAMANGVAVVCSPVGEIPAVLTDGIDALFVRPGDVSGLAAALQRVLQHDELMEELGRTGRSLYERQFSASRFFDSIARTHMRHFGVAAEPQSNGDDAAGNVS